MDNFAACRNGDLEPVLAYLREPDIATSDLANILHWAILFDRLPLIEKIAKIGIARESLETGLIHAAGLGKIEIVNKLLDFEIDLDGRDKSGNTPSFASLLNEKCQMAAM